ncbi:hypothetical protein XELAEV_18003707mg [Xenopus laevis]|nr:hypothetical protein XELAEV_18003707mg [Xenopus laevis]
MKWETCTVQSWGKLVRHELKKTMGWVGEVYGTMESWSRLVRDELGWGSLWDNGELEQIGVRWVGLGRLWDSGELEHSSKR